MNDATKGLYEDFVNNTVGKLDTEDRAQIDPITIIMLISLVVNIIRIIQECNKGPSDVKLMAKSPTLFERRKLNKEIRKMLGWGKSIKLGDTLTEAVLSTASETSEATIQRALEETQ